ncbi:hypothetical protein V5O48_016062 [Marasmius crinis-equi]|uniref:Uncharacterized protein n=1 Tax=Marasmius crinis-equi TaxID=585013 RepID=A0ABR3ESS8_9AGAR
MEMGTPMVCMYLLGHPDHYTDHKFIPFYWLPYVREARRHWHPDENVDAEEKINIIKKKDRVVGLSPVFDYIHRPLHLQNMCLYDFIRTFERKRLKRKRRSTDKPQDSCESELDIDSDNWDRELDRQDTGRNTRRMAQSTSADLNSMFLKDHPLQDTHGVKVRSGAKTEKLILNFTGKTLPRRDSGDHEYYCSTMLTLFKPWRTGEDLRNSDDIEWSSAFRDFSFSDRDVRLMDNFQIKYECLDARDDYRANLRSAGDPILYEWEDGGQDVDVMKGLKNRDYDDSYEYDGVTDDTLRQLAAVEAQKTQTVKA